MDGRLPSLIEATLYRSVQEALTNATKHGQSSQVTIQLRRASQEIRCSILDNGIGFDVPSVLADPGKRGLGLLGIKERIEALGAFHQITSAPGRGTELVITIPLGDLACPSGFSSPTTMSSSARA
jgi:two-component system sensor histidine kinase DegS